MSIIPISGCSLAIYLLQWIIMLNEFSGSQPGVSAQYGGSTLGYVSRPTLNNPRLGIQPTAIVPPPTAPYTPPAATISTTSANSYNSMPKVQDIFVIVIEQQSNTGKDSSSSVSANDDDDEDIKSTSGENEDDTDPDLLNDSNKDGHEDSSELDEDNRPSSSSSTSSDDSKSDDEFSALDSSIKLPPNSPGLYIATSAKNYAIVSPELAVNGWLSVSVNDDEVFIVSLNKKFQAGTLQTLEPMKRKELEKLAASFVRNTQGLQLDDGINSAGSYYTTSSQSIDSSDSDDFVIPAIPSTASSSQSSGDNNAYSTATSNNNNNGYGNAAGSTQPPGWCVKNYYENLVVSKLNSSLDGDIYYFDSHGNHINLFSSTVNSFCRDNLSIVFRDENYFSYSRLGLGSGWNRFFVSGTNAFIVYNDGTVLSKPTWALESIEFNAILRARTEVKQLANSQTQQARTNSKELMDPKLADIVSVVKNVLSSSSSGHSAFSNLKSILSLSNN